MTPKARVLLVGDDRRVIDLLALSLARQGLNPLSTYDADSALSLAESENPSAVLVGLDFTMKPGFELLQAFARRGQTGLIVLGTSRAEHDVKLAFDLGAQNYVPWPVSYREVHARIQASLRRVKVEPRVANPTFPQEHVLEAGKLRLELATRRACYALNPLYLSPTEFRILEQLMMHAGKLVRAQLLLRRVWGFYGNGRRDALRTAIGRLRSKLRAVGAGGLLETRRGVGFILRVE